jgi:dihydropyrimidinase
MFDPVVFDGVSRAKAQEGVNMAELDLVVRHGTIVTASDTFVCDIGVEDGKIAALGRSLSGAEQSVDATGQYVLPGGIDSHVHIEQDSPETGARPGTDFYTTTDSAACGGTTTLIPFARQGKGESLRAAVEEYRRKPIGKAVIDYALHLIVADPTAEVLGQEIPALIEEGYTSIKVYMTYKALMLSDYQILEVMSVARRHGAMVMIHAENADCIIWRDGEFVGEAGRGEFLPCDRPNRANDHSVLDDAGVPRA